LKKRLIRSLVRLYDYIYADKPFRNTKTVCFLVYKNKLVSFGVNSDKTSPMQNFYRLKTDLKAIPNFIDKEHAEINCLRKSKYEDIQFDKAELFVCSKRFDGTFRLSKPCPVCEAAIKDHGIHSIYYCTREQEIIHENI
jgi:tRNA(Arg) A34 adenosine deaminase TadA